jgi:tetratricopeptide (TPR) repeat protein
VGALSLLLLYAAFDNGATDVAAQARVQTALSAMALAAAVVSIWSGELRFSARPMAVAGLAALAAFAAWSGVTVLWSVAPDQTWLELNRALTYALALGLALLVGGSQRRSAELLANAALLVVLAVTVYALGQKLLPGLQVPGLFNLDQTEFVPRLQEPFGYWNALGLFIAFGVPIGLAVVADKARAPRIRLAALAAMELMLLAVGLTYSRGALLAMACGLIVGIALSGARLRSLMWLALAAVAMVAPLVVGLTDHALTNVSVSLGRREGAGLVLLAVLLTSLVALWFTGKRVMDVEGRVPVSPQSSRRIGRLLAAAFGIAVVCGVVAISVSSRGLTGTVSHAVDSFTTTRVTSDYDPSRLLSVDSQNRLVWWKEAAGAFSDRPLVGWGAGSFPVLHLLYRQNSLRVQHSHSVPLQWLAETGIIGALLAIGGYVLLTGAGVKSVRSKAGSERLVAAALLAAVVMYGVHALFDWDWDIPGVTLPALVFIGVLAGDGRRGMARSERRRPADGTSRGKVMAYGPGARAVALVAVAGALCAVALSGVVPSVAAGRASAAVVTAFGSSGSALEDARSDAAEATRLDPLSDAGLLASATIAFHSRQYTQARRYLLKAIKRDPNDVQAWQVLTVVEFGLGSAAGTLNAIEHVLALDPKGSEVNPFAKEMELLLAPPSGSATSKASPAPAS